jgi:hypothetical protein
MSHLIERFHGNFTDKFSFASGVLLSMRHCVGGIGRHFIKIFSFCNAVGIDET